MSRLTASAIAFALLVVACGDPTLAQGDELRSDPTTTSSTEPQTSTTTTMVPDLDPRLATALEQLDRLWTDECEASVQHGVARVFDDVLAWDPSFIQSIGDFGGDLSMLRADLQPVEDCPPEGFAIRYLTLIDDQVPTGDVNLLLGLAPFIESSVQAIEWAYGPEVALRLSPETDNAAPAPPVWPAAPSTDCDELGHQLSGFFQASIESANALSPLDGWESLGDGPPFDDLLFEESHCPIEDLLRAMTEGLAKADTTSFMAILLRWDAIIGVRELMRPSVLGESPVSMDIEVVDDRYQLVLTNHGDEAVHAVLVELWGESDNPYHGLDQPDFRWSQDDLGPGEEARVSTGLPAGTTIQTMASWTETNGVTRRNDFYEETFEAIGEVIP